MTAPIYRRLIFGASLLTLCASALADDALTSRPANVLAGPDDSYPVVASLDANTPIQVMGCLDDWSWCDVGFEGNRGWLYAPDITYGYHGGYVPLYTYAPALGITVVSFSVDNYWGQYYRGRPWYGQREEFIRRGPPHHERPPGPLPSHSPPPQQALMRKPDSHGGPIRVSSADARKDADTHRPDSDNHAGTARPEAKAPESHARPAEHAAPQHEAAPTHEAPAHEASPHEEKHAPAAHESTPKSAPKHEEPPPKAEAKEEHKPDRPE